MGQDNKPSEPGDAERDRYSRIAGRWVRLVWREAPPRLIAASQELVKAVETELVSRARRGLAVRWATRSLVLATGLAAVAGLLLVWHQAQSPGPRVGVRDPSTLVLLAGTSESAAAPLHGGSVAAGVRLLAPETGTLQLGSADGTLLTIEPGGSLTVVEAGSTKRFALLRGAVNVHVRRLTAGERFIVDAADAEIEVHGTTFRVAMSTGSSPCGKSSPTRVSVSEGVVTVNRSGHEEYLRPGDEWPPDCAAAVAASNRAEARSTDVSKRSARRKSYQSIASEHLAESDTVASGAPSPQEERQLGAAAPTSLEAQNDLFSQAVRAKRGGRVDLASRLFDRFVRTYPRSSLIESALVQQMRLLAEIDRDAAAAVAARYLLHFPDGFARNEARALTANQAPP